MTYDPRTHHRRSIRLPEYDYSSPGAYFVTICVQGKECALGEVVDDRMTLNDIGKMVHDVWDSLPGRYPGVKSDAFVVMPNHVHGIIVITDAVGAIHESPLPESPLRESQKRRTMLLPKIVGYFKMTTAKRANQMRGAPGIRFWQRNYWEHVVRDEADLNRIRQYIRDNPARWSDDQLRPAGPRQSFNRK